MTRRQVSRTETVHRRRFLASVGAVVAVPSLAGCLGDDDGGESGDEIEDDDETETLDEEQVQQQYDDAIDNLAENAAHLDELADPETERDSNDISQLQIRLDVARGALDDIEPHASGEIADQISSARTVLDFQEALIEAHKLGHETNQIVSDAITAADEGEYETAVDKYDEAVTLFQDQQALMNELEAVYVTLDTAVFDDPALEYGAELVEYLRIDDPAEIGASGAWLAAQREWNRAFLHVENGLNEWDREHWDTALTEFTSAQEPLQDAIEYTEDVRGADEASTELRQAAEALEGVIETQTEAFALFVQAAEAASDGDIEEGELLYQQAFQLLEGP